MVNWKQRPQQNARSVRPTAVVDARNSLTTRTSAFASRVNSAVDSALQRPIRFDSSSALLGLAAPIFSAMLFACVNSSR